MIKSMPLVSIVIPVFNQAEFLARAIDSVLSQKCSFDFELLVIDDGSTDNPAVVLSSYRNSFYWESRANCGQSATLNYAWGIAKAEILGYLSADDILKSGALQRVADKLIDNPSAVVAYPDFETMDADDHKIRYVRAPDFSPGEMLTRFQCPPGPGALFRRSSYKAAGGWDINLRRMPDYDFWLRMMLQGTFVRIPESLAMWRVHEGSQAFSKIPMERAEEPIRILENFFSRLGAADELMIYRQQSLASGFLVSAQLHARSSRYLLALSRFASSVSCYPYIIVSLHTWHVAANALFQQPAHRLLSGLRGLLGRLR
jgi:glycosyltransferase involved in cell wall biosynthesis